MLIDEALWYRRFGPPVEALTLEAAELGPRRPGTVRVRMIAAPINPSDLVPITGAYAHRVQPPRVAGYEGVGRVVESDPEAARLVGGRVLPLRGPGTWRRYIDCDPAWLVEVPDDIETAVAARAYINPLAALLMLRTWPVDGRRVVLTGGGSSCARLLGRWAIEAGAREVVAVHRSSGHAGSLAELGLAHLSMDNSEAITDAARSADVVFDAVGGALAESLLAALPRRSDFVSYGLLSGEPFRPTPAGPDLQRFHLRDYLADVGSDEWQRWFRDLWPMLRRSPMPEACCFPLADWRQALAAFEQPGRCFKPMLALDEDHAAFSDPRRCAVHSTWGVARGELFSNSVPLRPPLRDEEKHARSKPNLGGVPAGRWHARSTSKRPPVDHDPRRDHSSTAAFRPNEANRAPNTQAT